MKDVIKIGVIGGGSWATSIVKMLCENVNCVNWWMRNEDAIEHIQKYGHNPNYISDAELKKERLNISSNIAANSIILSNLSVLTKSISSYRKELIRSSIKLDLSKVPVTTSLINFLY